MMAEKKPLVSVCIPTYQHAAYIRQCLDSVLQQQTSFPFEIIIGEDDSTDGTREICLDYATRYPDQIRLFLRKEEEKIIINGNKTGRYNIIQNFREARGKYIAMLDGDLQNDPSDIPMMLDEMKRGDWDVVAGNRKNRKDGMFLRKIPSGIANALIRRWTGVYIKDYGCTLKIFRREIAEDLGIYGELHRFIPVLAKMQGARITQVDVKHHPRKFGKSKYGINRTFKVLSDLVLMVFFRKYIQKPMHLFGTIGFIAFGIGLLINLYLLILKIMGQDIWGKPILIAGLIFLLGGIQLITVGIIAEITVRTYFESQNKKTYKVRNLYEARQQYKPALEITV